MQIIRTADPYDDLVVVLFLERVVHAPGGVLQAWLGTALRTWLRTDEASIVELELGAGALYGARFLVAPMATLFHHGRSPGSGRR